MSSLKYIDCHSHPQSEKYEGVESFLNELKDDGGGTIAIGTDYETTQKGIALAKKYENVWATIGIHPADNKHTVYDEKKFEELLHESDGRVVGIGECGLDYYYFEMNKESDESFDEEKEKIRQKQIFISQINFAIKYKLPLVIHGRPTKNSMDAYRDILDILKEKSKDNKLAGHAHFFVGNLEIAKRFLQLGFYLSFDGPITFTKEYDPVIEATPIESILIETDAPYATPAPHRGKMNYPTYVKFVAKRIGEIKGLSEEEVLEKTLSNTKKLFNIA